MRAARVGKRAGEGEPPLPVLRERARSLDAAVVAARPRQRERAAGGRLERGAGTPRDDVRRGQRLRAAELDAAVEVELQPRLRGNRERGALRRAGAVLDRVAPREEVRDAVRAERMRVDAHVVDVAVEEAVVVADQVADVDLRRTAERHLEPRVDLVHAQRAVHPHADPRSLAHRDVVVPGRRVPVGLGVRGDDAGEVAAVGPVPEEHLPACLGPEAELNEGMVRGPASEGHERGPVVRAGRGRLRPQADRVVAVARQLVRARHLDRELAARAGRGREARDVAVAVRVEDAGDGARGHQVAALSGRVLRQGLLEVILHERHRGRVVRVQAQPALPRAVDDVRLDVRRVEAAHDGRHAARARQLARHDRRGELAHPHLLAREQERLARRGGVGAEERRPRVVRQDEPAGRVRHPHVRVGQAVRGHRKHRALRDLEAAAGILPAEEVADADRAPALLADRDLVPGKDVQIGAHHEPAALHVEWEVAKLRRAEVEVLVLVGGVEIPGRGLVLLRGVRPRTEDQAGHLRTRGRVGPDRGLVLQGEDGDVARDVLAVGDLPDPVRQYAAALVRGEPVAALRIRPDVRHDVRKRRARGRAERNGQESLETNRTHFLLHHFHGGHSTKTRSDIRGKRSGARRPAYVSGASRPGMDGNRPTACSGARTGSSRTRGRPAATRRSCPSPSGAPRASGPRRRR